MSTGIPQARAMAPLTILWHSQTGGTQAMVDALADGAAAAAPEVPTRRLHAASAAADDALAAGLLVFATPENLGAMSGLLKDWFDRAYYDLLDRVNGKPYALLVCAGSDGHNAIRQVERIATGLRLRQVAEPLLVNVGAQSPAAIRAHKTLPEAELARCRELGATLAAGMALRIW
jgi:NAD(P)H-dependent FMN reductase